MLGLSLPSKADGKNYTTLSYATGGPGTFQYTVFNSSDGMVVDRRDPSRDDVTDFEYISQAAILTDENTHGGGDVIVYAKGISFLLIYFNNFFLKYQINVDFRAIWTPFP